MTEYIKKEDAIEAVMSIFRVSALFSGMSDNEEMWREKAEKALAKCEVVTGIADTPQPTCDSCRHYGVPSVSCDRCDKGTHSRYEPKTDCEDDGADYLRGYNDGFYARGVLDKAGVEIHIDEPRGYTLKADTDCAWK